MNQAPPPVRHLDRVMTWHLAIPLWLSGMAILMVTTILSGIGLLLNALSVGSTSRTLSYSAFDSPAPSSVVIITILALAWQFCMIGWCALGVAPFKRTFKEVYVASVFLSVALVCAAAGWISTW